MEAISSSFKSIFIFISVLWISFEVQAQKKRKEDTYYKKELQYADATYEGNIKSVLLYQNTGDINDVFTSAVLNVNQDFPLTLEFDELGNQTYNYYFKIISCNSDWTPSQLADMEFLVDFNEFTITQYRLSFNTKVPYVHYQCNLPKIKLSGNFVIVVYRNGNFEDFVLSKRLMIYQNRVTITPHFKISTGVSERFTHQQPDFTVFYGDDDRVLNPTTEIKANIRQNQRWDNALINLTPQFLRDFEKTIDYQYYNLENNFPGGNEFRAFDTRRIRSNGLQVEQISNLPEFTQVKLMADKSRKGLAYLQNLDRNGKSLYASNEMGNNTGDPDYVQVEFSLNSELLDQAVYVTGAFSEWKPQANYRMNYDPNQKGYSAKVQLKQGYYNYGYGLLQEKSNLLDLTELEGTHSNTRNQYEIFIYHRPMGSRSDLLVGYYTSEFNGI